jgi:hypothetical protein
MREPTIYISTDGSVPSQRYAIDDPAIVEALAIAQAARDAGMVDEHGRFRKILGTLPITADGVVVVPSEDAEAWHPDETGAGYYERDTGRCEWSIRRDDGGYDYRCRPIEDCYSTRSAAEAAKGSSDAH